MTARTVRQRLTEQLQGALETLFREGYLSGDVPAVELTPPRDAQHGDLACNVALAVAKANKKNPREIATKILAALGTAGGLVAKSEVAGPGFLNLFVADAAWRETLASVLALGPDFLRTDFGKGEKVLVEFVSANPTGPLHIAHGRGAATGDTVAKLLETAGFAVEREYYVNDLGNQADIMARSIYLRYETLFGWPLRPAEDFYPGDYIIDIARSIRDEEGNRYLDRDESEWLDTFRARGIAEMMHRIREDLDRFGVRFDRFVSERELTERVGLGALITKLTDKGHVYEDEGKKWFRSTTFGDDKDRVVVREDGRPTYFASDVAYHYDKMQRGFTKLINVWGADHGGYVARMRASLAALGYPPDALEVILVQMVSLSRGGESVRMGKRLGTAVWLRDVVDEAGRDATRYFFLMRRSDAQLDFDLELATKKSLDNPVYYAQMGHARMCAIAARARQAGIAEATYAPGALEALVLPEEMGLLKALDNAPQVVLDAARSREPHAVVHYLQDLIAQFHSYYTKYKHTEKVVCADPVKTRARLLLCQGLRVTLRALLDLLGVEAPERMVLPEEED